MKRNISYTSKFYIQDKKQNPDFFKYSSGTKCKNKPNKDFVISRDKNGETISKYGDEIWILKPYCTTMTENHSIYFKSIRCEDREDIKWICFMMMYMSNTGLSGRITPATIQIKFKSLKYISIFAKENKTYMANVFSSGRLMIKYIQAKTRDKNRSAVAGAHAILTNLLQLEPELVGFKLVEFEVYKQIKKAARFLDSLQKKQHAVIPPRIFAGYISELWDIINYYIENQKQILKLLERTGTSNGFGIKKQSQLSKYGGQEPLKKTFKEACKIYNLVEYFDRYKINNNMTFGAHLTTIQFVCKLLIVTYSGMRSSEVSNLMYECLKKTKTKNGNIIRLIGNTSKNFGSKIKTSWITSFEIEKVILLLQNLAKLGNRNLNLPMKELPLLLNRRYINVGNTYTPNKYSSLVARLNDHHGYLVRWLDLSKITIMREDIDFLKKIEPTRDWENSKNFKLNQTWKITNHQLRRSLAFYVAQSGVVSATSLKNQMKHVNLEMSLYYANGSGLDNEFINSNHIKTVINKNRPLANSIAYMDNLILNNEKIHGAHGVKVERIKKDLTEDQIVLRREDLFKDFLNGHISYDETPLGACTSREPCNQKAMSCIFSCISCKDAAIIPSKLNIVISEQEKVVQKTLEQNPDSIELKIEQEDLSSLKTFRDKMEKENVLN